MEISDFDIVKSFPIDWEQFRNTSILVTGATGRLGIFIVETLCGACIDWNLSLNIVAVARNETKAKEVFGETLNLPFVNLLIQDATDAFDLDGPIDYIFHTAGPAAPEDFTHNPVGTLWAHVEGTRNVLELARLKHSKKVLYVSTVEIYGNWESEVPITEGDMGPVNCNIARSCYPEAKRLCETMLASYKAQFGLDFTSLRMSHTIGPNISLTDGRAFAEFIRNLLDGNDIILRSDGSAVRTYTYVADAIGAMFLAVTKGKENFYNVANNANQISIRDLAHLIAENDDKGAVNVIYEGVDKDGLVYLPFNLGLMDVAKITEIGWRPKVDIATTFRRTISSLINN